jgi:hypothetical protein
VFQVKILDAAIEEIWSRWYALANSCRRLRARWPFYRNPPRAEQNLAVEESINYALSKKNFEDIFSAAYAGFTMSKDTANGRLLKVHTGKLGCGVFKNDPVMSVAAQILAARIVGVGKVQFYDISSSNKVETIKKIINDTIAEISEENTPASIGELVSATCRATKFEPISGGL